MSTYSTGPGTTKVVLHMELNLSTRSDTAKRSWRSDFGSVQAQSRKLSPFRIQIRGHVSARLAL